MRNRRRLIMRTSIFIVISLALGYTFYLNFLSDRGVSKIGASATNFILEDLEGHRIELNNLKGKGVFLNFWGTFCPECVKEMPIMDDLYQEYREQGVEIIAINVDEPRLTVQRFTKRLDLSFPIAIDKGMNVTVAYGIGPLPTTVLIDENGIIVDVYTGPLTEEITRSFMEKIKPN